MVTSESRPEKEAYILVAFYYGASLSQIARYTSWERSILGHTPEPRMSVLVPENEGTFDQRTARVVLPNDAFVTRASSGLPHSPIFVVIQEVTQGLFPGDQDSFRTLFRGRVDRVIRNFQGQSGRSAFLCLNRKARLKKKMGLPCNHQCAWALFHGGCGVDQASYQINTEIDSVDGQEVTITDSEVTALGVADERYWKRGWMRKDGLVVSIRDYNGGEDPTKFYMKRRVPSDWIGGSNDILIVPGCDKTIETCRARFDAEEFFLGMGYAIPAYQPNTESPG